MAETAVLTIVLMATLFLGFVAGIVTLIAFTTDVLDEGYMGTPRQQKAFKLRGTTIIAIHILVLAMAFALLLRPCE